MRRRCLGTTPGTEIKESRKVCVDYTVVALKALTPETEHKDRRFRFVYLSGGLAERDQAKALWFAQQYRRMRVCSMS